jgi:hypothetical protein
MRRISRFSMSITGIEGAEPSSPVLRTSFGRATLPAVQRLKQQDRPVSAVAAGG